MLAGFGHSTSFWTEQPEAGSRLIITFFDSGRVDDSLYKPQSVDFTPEVTQTALAKGIAGAMVGLALLTVLSLLWMPRRVHKRGRIGRKSGTLLRSVYPLVLGLGGWFLGVLIVITTMPGVPLDDELLAALSVGLPIGLGIYFAWVNRDWSAKTKTTGFAAATGGALVGAWLGFNATEGLFALITTIVGAAVGGNLVLLALDMSWDRQVRDRFATRMVTRAAGIAVMLGGLGVAASGGASLAMAQSTERAADSQPVYTLESQTVRTDASSDTGLSPGIQNEPIAASRVDRSITQRDIGGAGLGLARQAYVRAFGRLFRVDMLEGGLTRLVFTRLGVETYLKGNAGVVINTYGRAFRTSASVGPCLPVGALTAAYGGRLRKLPASGPVSLYRFGNLVFRVVTGRVEAVTLGKGQLAVLVAGNSTSPDCSSSASSRAVTAPTLAAAPLRRRPNQTSNTVRELWPQAASDVCCPFAARTVGRSPGSATSDDPRSLLPGTSDIRETRWGRQHFEGFAAPRLSARARGCSQIVALCNFRPAMLVASLSAAVVTGPPGRSSRGPER